MAELTEVYDRVNAKWTQLEQALRARRFGYAEIVGTIENGHTGLGWKKLKRGGGGAEWRVVTVTMEGQQVIATPILEAPILHRIELSKLAGELVTALINAVDPQAEKAIQAEHTLNEVLSNLYDQTV